jgi:dipeptidyl aminopeptidase/acylaminoacyl peptidase/uncharacterized protein (DUF2132 family)
MPDANRPKTPSRTTPAPQRRNPLHGVTLEAMLAELVAHFGWSELGQRIRIKSFNVDPSIASSLKFLRKTPWAREKVEGLYLFMRREQTWAEPPVTAATPASRSAEPAIAPFGSWASPISAELIAGATLRLGQIQVRGDDIFWSEGRPQEQGRNVLVWHGSDGRSTDLTPAPLNVRSRVHEYGGGAFTLGPRAGFFTNDADQQIWRIRANEAPQPLTSEPGTRHADIVIDARRKRLICVREDHRAGDREALNTIVGIKLSDGAAQVLASGHDFYSTPRLSPDGQQFAWLSWDHPNMPWDGCELWLADIAADGSLQDARCVAGSAAEAIFQPSWSPRGELHFVSDRSDWWNLYRWRDGKVEPLLPMDAEFGVPQWAFGQSTYGFDARGRIVCSYTQDGVSRLGVLDVDATGKTGKTGTGRFKPLALPFCAISELQVGADFAVFIGGSATAPEAIVRLDLASGEHRVLRSASPVTPETGFVSQAEAIDFPTVAGLAAHAFFYRPANRDFIGPPNEHAPLIVISHGGPTGATNPAFKWSIQYWTSRGFAVVDVNYGGSSGYGRAYRERLNGCWGVVDVDDCVNAARFLIERGDVDPARLAIRGSSAGGYTTLCALTFRQFFGCGASLYGVGDLEALALDTHKFESRYLDRLVGPYPAQRALYRQRSPVHHTERLASPMILLQGSEDRVVPPEQARAMFEAVRAKGLPVAFVLFDGEQHGFRRAATIRRALEAELYFHGRVFGFVPADAIDPVPIENLGGSAKP